jgi:hypothetical protein
MFTKKTLILILILVVLILAGGLVLNGAKQMTPKTTPPPASADEIAVRDLVTEFGAHLKNVPLAADPQMLKEIIRTEYAPYVTPELLAKWQAYPQTAPGRLTSSPWPERIDITSVTDSGVQYVVKGTIVLMTSEEVAHGGVAGTEPVTIALEKRNGTWLIVGYLAK